MERTNCNAVITVQKAWYLPGASLQSMPSYVTVEVRSIACGQWKQSVNLPLEALTTARLKKACHFLRTPGKRADLEELDCQLVEQLQAGLSADTIERGYYLDHSGIIQFPDSTVRFLAGEELIPDHCSRSYLCSPNLSDMRLAGDGSTGWETMAAELSLAPKPALLTLAYVLLTSVRSLLLESGIDYAAILYILGGQGLGKTTLAKRTAGIYQGPRGEVVGLVQAGSSSAGVESLMASFRDQPVIVDDLCLSAGRETARQRRETGAKLVRIGAGDVPIVKRFGQQTRETRCCAGIILTAEFPLENASDLSRCILVPVRKRLDLADTWNPALIGDMLRCFLNWFSLHHKEALGHLSAALAGSDIQESEPRVCTNYNCLRWAFQMFLRSLVSKGMHPARNNQLSLRMDRAINLALRQYQLQKEKLDMTIRRGNLPYCILEGYRNKAFHLTKNVEKLNRHDGIVWKNDLCLRPKILLAYIRKQPGYQDYTQNRLSMELADLSALVLQEENSYTVHIAKSEHSQIPRVYRIKLNVLKKTAQKE